MLLGLGKNHEGGGLQPSIDLIERRGQWRRRIIDAVMRDDSEKLVQARPRDRPSRRTRREVGDASFCNSVELRVLTAGMNEEVGIDRDQEPRPS